MHLSAQEFNSHFLMLPQSEQQKVIDFVLKKYLKTQFPLFQQVQNPAVKNVDTPRKLGLFKGKINMAEDFNAPLSDSFWLEGKP